MTLAEFKAWLEGYSASFKDGTPNVDQWAEVLKRIEGVTAVLTIQSAQTGFGYAWPAQHPVVSKNGPTTSEAVGGLSLGGQHRFS